ncbi:TraB/GumN family protein [Aurantiacibacter rhizosphaerae]|uniref:TraB/GumN family protein n=1 Tax=Aurantiacibacter rhizosphaerae TaxID=2691582 RepID=A0A844XEE8_9SPHN|nr:TraB/GumN family protein [Aurantiacibacter rhizosphaerae]MWV27974.1 hypothetical protein [Aurantiacibacter rhizosphaerae]
MITRQIKALLAGFAAIATLCAAPAIAEDEARYAFTQDYEPAPALWRLSDEDTTIYMLGTIHLLPKGFRWRNPDLDAIIDAADVLVVESNDFDGSGSLDVVAPKIAHLLQNRTPTSQQLSAPAKARWRELVAQSGQPFAYVDAMPVMVALMGFGPTGPGSELSSYDYGVEAVLEREFIESERPIESIEDFGRVLYSLYHANDAEMVKELDLHLRKWSREPNRGLYGAAQDDLVGDDYWAMEHAWARGEVSDDFDLGFGDGRIGKAFREILLNRRNRRWAGWLEERLDQPGTALLAVGAGHFEGPDSLLVWLKQRGLKAERIN